MKLILAMACLITLTGCALTPANPEPAFSIYDLTSKVWRVDCVKVGDKPVAGEFRFYQSGGNMFYQAATSYYADDNCKEEVMTDYIERKLIGPFPTDGRSEIIAESIEKSLSRATINSAATPLSAPTTQ